MEHVAVPALKADRELRAEVQPVPHFHLAASKALSLRDAWTSSLPTEPLHSYIKAVDLADFAEIARIVAVALASGAPQLPVRFQRPHRNVLHLVLRRIVATTPDQSLGR